MLTLLARIYREEQKTNDAEEAYCEALSIYRRISASDPETNERVALVLNDLGSRILYCWTDQSSGGIFHPGFELYRKLETDNPGRLYGGCRTDAWESRLFLVGVERMNRAQEACTEALSIYRSLRKRKATGDFVPHMVEALRRQAIL